MRFHDLLEQSNQAGMSFLMTEMDTAMTFLSVAATTRHEDSAIRNRGNALIAYECILHYQGRLRFSMDEKVSFDLKLAVVRRALIAIGFVV